MHVWGIKRRNVYFFETKMECFFKDGIKKENEFVEKANNGGIEQVRL